MNIVRLCILVSLATPACLARSVPVTPLTCEVSSDCNDNDPCTNDICGTNGCIFTDNGTCGAMCLAERCESYEACHHDTCTCFIGYEGCSYNCVAKSDGTLWCSGHNTNGEVGIDSGGATVPTPTRVALPQNLDELAAGESHVCAVLEDGSVWCWGRNDHNQLGDGTGVSRHTPAPVPLLSDIVSADAGEYHSCAIKEDGTAWCWGNNNGSARLGDGTTTPRDTPVQVQDMPPGRPLQIALSDHNSCVLMDDGTVWCWGSNTSSSTGTGVTGTPTLTPARTLNVTGAVALAGGHHRHQCALDDRGRVWCWGGNEHGEVGLPNTDLVITEPTQVGGLGIAVGIDVGTYASYAVVDDGTVWCWGRCYCDGAVQADSHTPCQLPGLDDAVSVGAGCSHACSARQDGSLVCYGTNGGGQLGTGAVGSPSLPVEPLLSCP